MLSGRKIETVQAAPSRPRRIPSTDPARSPEYWKRVLAPFKGADDRRSTLQLGVTAALFVAGWTAMWWSLGVHYGLTLLLALPTSGLMIRLFIVQHDCGHGSYFRSRRARNIAGFCIGVIALIPYQYWRRTHAYHHAHSGDLDFRGLGDVDTLTVREYRALPPLKRLGYRLYRNPVVLLGLGPFFQFVVKHRYPWDVPKSWRAAWSSVWWTNLGIAGVVTAMALTLGLKDFLLVQTPITLLTGTIGVFLFYVQHQFEDTYWDHHDEWDYYEASLLGSSHLVLPKPLQWMTGSIGIHHVHHLNALIPNYRLQECLDSIPELQHATQITMRDGWRLLWLSLWDEQRGRLIRFGELRDAA